MDFVEKIENSTKINFIQGDAYEKKVLKQLKDIQYTKYYTNLLKYKPFYITLYVIVCTCMKERITVSVDKELLSWVDAKVSRRIFANRSHGFEFLINNEVKKRERTNNHNS